jgi:hypothetical protein
MVTPANSGRLERILAMVYVVLYRTIGLILDSIHHLVCRRQKTTTFRRLDLSPSSVGLSYPIHLRTETDLVSETLRFFCFLHARRWIESKISPIVLPVLIAPNASYTSIIRGRYNMPTSSGRTKWTESYPYSGIKENEHFYQLCLYVYKLTASSA